MKRFTELYLSLDQTNKTNQKVDALARYFKDAPPADASWAVYFLCGNRLRRAVNTRLLREWVAERAGLPLWLVEECYEVVGDLAETLARILPRQDQPCHTPLHQYIEQNLKPLQTMSEPERKRTLQHCWDELSTDQCFVWNKIITGGFRVGVSRALVVRALSQIAGIEQGIMAHRLMGEWTPSTKAYNLLFSEADHAARDSIPYPFFLASPLESEPESLGNTSDWQAEWKWDGIRGQIIRRSGQTWIWTRGEELVTDRYPELSQTAARFPDGIVLDGEILAWKNGGPLPFTAMQKRIGRKTIGSKMLKDIPVVFKAFDLLEQNSEDIRHLSMSERRALLEKFIHEQNSEDIHLSPLIEFESWQELANLRGGARDNAVEGLMLKKKSSGYGTRRTREDWWKWKVDPYSIDAVMIYAQRGHGRRAGLYSDYTFAVWDETGNLVPITKAYSGLTDKEMRQVDQFIKRNTIERFGPVRSVKPELVFELHFDDIQKSTRHKSGIALRFPRMARWRADKPATEADTLASIHRLLETTPHPGGPKT